MNLQGTVLLLPLLSVLLFNLYGCSENELTPEDEIRQYIETGKEAAENRSTSDVLELIRNDYQDQKGLDKKQIKNLLRVYFLRHSNIHLFTKIDNIHFKNDNQAFVVVYIAMAGNVITGIDSLNSLRAQVYRFELLLLKDESWLLKQARWQRAKPADLF